MATFSDAVRERSDDELVALLRARPDLASPSPSTLRSLAARASSRTSVERALVHADTPTLQVLEAVLALEGELPAVGPDDVAAAVGAQDPDAAAAVRGLLAAVAEQALVWDAGEAGQPDLRPAPGLGEVLGPYPAGLGPRRDPGSPAPDLTGLDSAVAALPPGAREVLDALAWGPPAGVVPPDGTAARRAVDALVDAGLLQRAEARTVVLPRDVGLALRDGRTHRDPALAPPAPRSARTVREDTADAESASAALEAVRLVDVLVTAWEENPPPVLRAGGLGVRDVRRAAQTLDVDEATAAAVVELAAAAGLVADDGDAPASYVPTTVADAWDEADDADRWAMLAVAWAASRRTPWLAGTRDEKGATRAPLSADLHRAWVPRLRGQVLAALAGMPGLAPSTGDVLADLAWRTPRAVPPEPAVEGLLREAALLGITGAGSLAAPGRALLPVVTGEPTADGGAAAALAGALRAVLPAEVDEVLLQGDLTGIVPGRPSRALASLIGRTADVESRGGATTVRFSAASVTRALDLGASADDLLDELGRRSPVPVPQPLEYLVRDTARRHEALRVGTASSYVRAADPAVLAGLAEDPRLASLGLVRLAPTVLATAVPAAELQAALRSRGLLAALEGPDGRPLGRLRRPPRIDRGPGRGARSAYAVASAPVSDDGRRALVERLRVADGGGTRSPFSSTAAGADAARATVGDGAAHAILPPPTAVDRLARTGAVDGVAGDTLALLREAVRDGEHVWLELVDAHGRPARRRVRPLRLEAGRLRALDTSRGAELTVAVHRIASVEPDEGG
ncbi:hypothetical protein DNL40_03975 [Xylanimonas oleitrophica]|uniref:Helicase XPB/Ssl2 N-terminal domain-containing protein n=1 Tax=Xylanimonas oleitrophica TaxID=2607479 RepID=A0A2W5X1F6_9MICO|nr:helicase-associated domain-containing protein [Xylanimonas oleitrophica]PZR54105.1 hypothetical protein DNL40_03975 [Xylanimonas oleitrophica]